MCQGFKKKLICGKFISVSSVNIYVIMYKHCFASIVFTVTVLK